MKRFTRQFTWGGLLLLLFSLTAEAAYWRWSGTVPKFRFISGWALFAVMVFLTLYNARKKLIFLRMGSSEAWAQFHIYAGYFTVLLLVLHLNIRWPTGWFECALALLRNSVSRGVSSGAFFFTVAGPKASKWTSDSGTPQASSPSVMLFMKAPFPQR